MKNNENTTSDPGLCSLYSLLPSINDLLLSPDFSAIVQVESHSSVVRATRAVLLCVRQEIAAGKHTLPSLNNRLAGLHLAVAEEINQKSFNDALQQIGPAVRKEHLDAELKALQAKYNVKIENPAYFAPRAPAQLQQVH